MSLIPCPACKHLCSPAAASCPNCGHQFSTPRRGLSGCTLFFIIIFAIVVAFIFIAVLVHLDRESDKLMREANPPATTQPR